ncbi:RagB/SusD family nutrient uptake outer membrane protein [Desertivirga xinjiangensis]|uniref:RagB/SusD family nutrient uptake outer membrane protein n=1 Tax=Desertivirga xinjiangensis TaxID=539206 RepID=UPI00210C2313|nr:RagB/SusD family nutrient uptake outer membrane protein [Pedobacter xinjiangensis]
MKKTYIARSIALMILAVSLLLASCEKYLDLKPNKTLSVPATAGDLQALLDNETAMNTNYPAAGDIASDNLILNAADWGKLFFIDDRKTYTWEGDAQATQDWSNGYYTIFNANAVLDLVDKAATGEQHNILKGSALFFRGLSHFQLAQVFTLPYDKATAAATAGLPLRLSSDFNDKTVRSSLEQTYNQIRNDLEQAAGLLPVSSAYKTRPAGAAAFAVLARLNLVLEDYAAAGRWADSCLALQSSLLDYNLLSASAANPFTLFNQEVIFHAINKGNSGVFVANVARVDRELYAAYDGDDLRKGLFFTVGADQGVFFKGDYAGKNNGSLFAGITTSEMYLMRAECYAREGKKEEALEWLNKLLIKRRRASSFVPFTAATAEEALGLILQERRKELVFRSGLRWMDLRRLNRDARFAVTLRRVLDGKEYVLGPGHKRYAFLIPEVVVTETGVGQNER